MRNSKRLLSLVLVLVLCFSTVIVSSLTASGSETEERTLAFAFEDDYYDKTLVNARPTTCLCSNDGSMRMTSDHNAQQYQMMFRVSDVNAERLSDAIIEACEFYTGQLTVQITVNSAKTIYGTDCRPTVEVQLLGATADGKPDYNNRIGTTGANQQAVEIPVNYYLDVSQFALAGNSYNYDVKFVYVQVQCYDWGCGGGKGTTPDVTFDPIYVDNGEEPTTDPISTTKPDPNQSTFFKFSPSAKNDYQNGPAVLQYSADGATWKRAGVATAEHHGFVKLSQTLNFVEQMQVNYNFNAYQDEAKNALNLANAEGGTGLMKVTVTLESCKDPYGNSCPAEISIQVDTQAGALGDAPEAIKIVGWQYPGTSRVYYLDFSNIKHFSQLKAITFRAQNYWYYNEKHELFDYDQESNYAGEAAGLEKGYKKCRIKPVMIVSPVTVVKEVGTYANTAYDLVLNDFNKNGGYVPDPITLVDPNNPDLNNIVTSTKSTSGSGNNGGNGNDDIIGTTVAVKPATPVMYPAKLIGKKAAKITWSAAKNATHYEIYRAVGSNKAANFKYFTTVSKNVLSFSDTTLKNGKKYYYKVRAVNNGGTSKLVSSFSVVKGVKVINYSAKPKIKVTSSAKSKAVVKVTKKVTNATKYQIKYSLKSNMKSAKSTTVKTKKTIKKLKSGKTYYVRVRAVVKINGKNYYGKWSAKEKVKVK